MSQPGAMPRPEKARCGPGRQPPAGRLPAVAPAVQPAACRAQLGVTQTAAGSGQQSPSCRMVHPPPARRRPFQTQRCTAEGGRGHACWISRRSNSTSCTNTPPVHTGIPQHATCGNANHASPFCRSFKGPAQPAHTCRASRSAGCARCPGGQSWRAQAALQQQCGNAFWSTGCSKTQQVTALHNTKHPCVGLPGTPSSHATSNHPAHLQCHLMAACRLPLDARCARWAPGQYPGCLPCRQTLVRPPLLSHQRALGACGTGRRAWQAGCCPQT